MGKTKISEFRDENRPSQIYFGSASEWVNSQELGRSRSNSNASVSDISSSRRSSVDSYGPSEFREGVWGESDQKDEANTDQKDRKEAFRNWFFRILPHSLEVDFWSAPHQMTIFRIFWIYFFVYQISHLTFVGTLIKDMGLVIFFSVFIAVSLPIFYFSWNPGKSILKAFVAYLVIRNALIGFMGFIYGVTIGQTTWEEFDMILWCGQMVLGVIPLTFSASVLIINFCGVIYLGTLGKESATMLANNIGVFILFYFMNIQVLRESELTRKQEFLYAMELEENTKLLEDKRKKSETLIMNILPSKVSRRLKRKRALTQLDSSEGVMVSEQFKQVTILFADIVGFTTLSERHNPEDIVNTLNDLFTSFDKYCEKYNVEKIKTIGDAYVAVCGLPYQDVNHARAVIELGLDMIKDPVLINNPLNETISIRVGLSSGKVTAGVIGAHRWCYDVYGDAVHETEKEEAAAPTNAVRISKTTLESLLDRDGLSIQKIDGEESYIITRDSDIEWKNPNQNHFSTDVYVDTVNDKQSELLKKQFQISLISAHFKDSSVQKHFWKWKTKRLDSQLKPHLLVGMAITICFLVIDAYSNSTAAMALSIAFYIPFIFVSILAYFFHHKLMRDETRFVIISVIYYSIFIIAVVIICQISPKDPIRMVTRIELYMGWITSSPLISFWGLVITSGVQLVTAQVVRPIAKPNVTDYISTLQSLFLPGLLFMGKYFSMRNEKKTFTSFRINEYKKAHVELEARRADMLLLNILPDHIIQALKKDATFIAKSYPEVSCMFVKLIGAESMSPIETTSLLNGVFSTWDKLTASFGLEKIKTIGFSYMVVGGAEGDPQHLMNMANLAFSIQNSMEELVLKYEIKMNVSIGISLGPCVGGVIGRKKFCYDMWGDTINSASRMQSNGTVGKIHVISEAAQHLRAMNFRVESRGVMKIKGKGEIETAWLLP